jgi:EAL domain-containing protein (putative c-di-GMP-specific phosphodiesterase class I)
MVDALIGLAHKLNLMVCAEGVEDQATLDALSRFGCDYAQGYYISPPVRALEFPKIVTHWDQRQRQPARKISSP